MAEPSTNILSHEARFSWVRLRTLVMLRWMTIAGQSTALWIAVKWLQVDIRVDLAATVIGIAVAFNIVATVVFPENRRLSERAALLTLIFDLTQLAALLALAGGLMNPFAVLLLTPVVMASTACFPRSDEAAKWRSVAGAANYGGRLLGGAYYLGRVFGAVFS